LFGEGEGKRLFERHRRKWNDNIKRSPELGLVLTGCIHVAEGRNFSWRLVNAVMVKGGELLE
jgi:hypothetical protein